MAVFNDLQLKQWFETGDFPTQQQFFNLIDSKVNVLDLPALLGLSIGVTNITGGADKNILFQQGTKVSQDLKFVYDYTNRRIGVNISAPLSGFHAFSTIGNVDPAPLVMTFQRSVGVINSNTTWFAFNAMNGAGQGVGGFNCGQQTVGQGTRLSFSVTNNSALTPATEGMRLSQEKRLSVGVTILNGATIDAIAESSLSTSKIIRARNGLNTADIFQVLGDNSLIGSGSMSFDAKQTHNAGVAVTINGNVRVLNVNPALVIAGLTITLPSTVSIKDGQEVLIVYGGTILAGNVLTGLTIVANAGQTLINNAAIGTMKAGDCHAFKWIASLNSWFNIKGL